MSQTIQSKCVKKVGNRKVDVRDAFLTDGTEMEEIRWTFSWDTPNDPNQAKNVHELSFPKKIPELFLYQLLLRWSLSFCLSSPEPLGLNAALNRLFDKGGWWGLIKSQKSGKKSHFGDRESRFWESKSSAIKFKPRSSVWDGFRDKKGVIFR